MIIETMLSCLHEEEERQAECEQDLRDGDLQVPMGKLLVCPTGVTAIFAPRPLRKLNHHYPWRWVPAGIAVLKLIVFDHGFGTAATLALNHLSSDEKDLLAEEIGEMKWIGTDEEPVIEHDSDLIESVMKIVEWVPMLATKCPYQSVSHDLEKLPTWDLEQLDQYVMRTFMS